MDQTFGINLMNEICNICYSSQEFNGVARSFMIKDIIAGSSVTGGPSNFTHEILPATIPAIFNRSINSEIEAKKFSEIWADYNLPSSTSCAPKIKFSFAYSGSAVGCAGYGTTTGTWWIATRSWSFVSRNSVAQRYYLSDTRISYLW